MFHFVHLATQNVHHATQNVHHVTRTVQPSADYRLSTSQKKQIARGVKRFFDKNYELRYNELKQVEEFRGKATNFCGEATGGRGEATNFHGEATGDRGEATNFRGEATGCRGEATNFCGEACGWQQLTDRELRKMVFEQMEQVGVAWGVDVEQYVRSSLIPRYNPVTDYLNGCPAWDGTDHIRALARRVPCGFREWPDWWHRWFLAMVAQWQQLSRDHGNSLVPMLIGQQGTRKSTFCRMLLPPSLRDYYIDDIKLDTAEQVERMISRMLLVNIDEYNAKTDREQAKIKRILTECDVQTRKMRSDQYESRRRTASFIATTNEREPLTDATGSRRYLCCEVTGPIDTETPIDHRQLYAQAIYELDHGAPYFFTRDEEMLIELHNTCYQQQSSPEQLLLAYYEPAPRQKEHYLRAVDIQRELQQHVRAVDVPNLKTLTMALKRSHFLYGGMDGCRGWYAKRRTPEKE